MVGRRLFGSVRRGRIVDTAVAVAAPVEARFGNRQRLSWAFGRAAAAAVAVVALTVVG